MLINFTIWLSVASGSYLGSISDYPYRIGSLITGFFSNGETPGDLDRIIDEMITDGKVRGIPAHGLVASLQSVVSLEPSWGVRGSRKPIDVAVSLVRDRIISFFQEPDASQRLHDIHKMQKVLDCLLVSGSIHPSDKSVSVSSFFNILYLFQWISMPQLEAAALPPHHLELIYTIESSKHLFPSPMHIASVYAGLLQFRDTGLVMTYMECLEEKSSAAEDPLLNFIHQQLIYDKLTQFNDIVTRTVHLGMYDRLLTSCKSAKGLSQNLLVDFYSTVIQSEEFLTSRDFIIRSNVQRTLVSVVLLSFELSITTLPNHPNLVEYLLWCFTASRIGEFPDTEMEELIHLNRNVYGIRKLLSNPSTRAIDIEEHLLEAIGNQIDHANSMLVAGGFNLAAPGGACLSRFGDDENSVSHCTFAMGILERSFDLMQTETVSASGLTRPICVGMWYLILVLRSPKFANNPSCINRHVMTMDAFIIKAQREITEGSSSISTTTESVLESFLNGIIELSAQV